MTTARNWLQRHHVAAYTLLFVIASGIVFYFIPVTRTSLINSADGFNQYYPAYVYIGRYLRELIPTLLQEHTIPMFDFALGYGDDILTTLNYYGYGNVFYLLSALAPAKYAAVLYTIETLLQIYLAGLAWLYVTRRMDLHIWPRIAGAIVYAFSAYTLAFGVTFPTFLMALITFPFIIEGAGGILRNERLQLSGSYILALFLLSCCGFYFLYMDVIAVAIYGMLYGLFYYRRRLGAYVRAIRHLLLQSGIAVGMSGVILLPTVIAYLSSGRSQEERDWSEILSLYRGEQLLERVRGILVDPGYGSALGLTIPVLFLLVIFLVRHARRYPLIAAEIVLCIAGYFLPVVGAMMNGFSYSSDRWMFIAYYFIAMGITVALEQCTETAAYTTRAARSAWVICGMVALLWAIATITSGDLTTTQRVVRILIVGLSLATLALATRRGLCAVACSVIACTVLIAWLVNLPTAVGGDGYHRSFKNFYAWHEVASGAMAQAAETDTFHRIDIYDSSLGSSLVLGVNSASSYFSMYNSGPYQFLAPRLVSTGTEASSYTLRGLDGRKALEMFYSVTQYALDRSSDVIVKNNLALPFGFTYTSYMLEEDAEDADPLDRNQNVLKMVELETQPQSSDLTRITESDRDWETIPCEVQFCNTTQEQEGIIRVDETSEIRVSLPQDMDPIGNYEYYVLLHGLTWQEDDFERYLIVGGKRMRIRPMDSYPLQQSEYMVKLDLSAEDVERGYVVIEFLEDATYHLESLELRRLDISQYEEYYGRLTESVLEDVTYAPNRISGRLTTDQDRILLMTIPYSTGWTCTVDGVRQTILRADQGYSAVVIGAGEHEVVWTYRTPGIEIGGGVSLASVVILLALLRKGHKGWTANE